MKKKLSTGYRNISQLKFSDRKLSMKEQLNVIGRTKLFFGTGGSSPISIFQPKDSVFLR